MIEVHDQKNKIKFEDHWCRKHVAELKEKAANCVCVKAFSDTEISKIDQHS